MTVGRCRKSQLDASRAVVSVVTSYLHVTRNSARDDSLCVKVQSTLHDSAGLTF